MSIQTTEEWCRIPQTIGSEITHAYYQYLVKGYAEQHPTEQKSVYIPKAFILETLEKFPVVSGLRFMYGQQEGADPASRTIVLMACDNGSCDRHVPNLILRPTGYLTDTGDRITLDHCWELLTRYVDHMCSITPGESRKGIPRACFFGITTMKSLLDTPGCAGINYHFGYNPETKIHSERYEAVMEAVDSNGQSLHMYVEQGQRCPTICDGECPGTIDIPVGWPFSATHKGSEQIQEGELFEMFHYVSPPLFQAVQDEQLYSAHFSECLALVETGNEPKARQVLRKELDNMMEKYLFAD